MSEYARKLLNLVLCYKCGGTTTTWPNAETVNGHKKNTFTAAVTLMMMLMMMMMTMMTTVVEVAALHLVPHFSLS